ncbi:MAG: DUF58 domain-containing protein [Hahellaceae bacterium]|nr:DUF58 domain-containing protein [Hahellaceae bacterium]
MVSPRAGWAQFWGRWLERRIPGARIKQLSHRDVFVFPTGRGGVFIALIALLLITGINYENAMILATGCLFAALFVLHIVQAYRNLAGLEIQFRGAEPVFAGEDLGLAFQLKSDGGDRYGLELGRLPSSFVRVDVLEGSATPVRILYRALQRGRCRPGRLLLTTAWPFGWVRAWSWLDLMVEAWVYPRREDYTLRGGRAQAESDGGDQVAQALPAAGSDDYIGLRPYRPGEPMSRIAWKKLAQSGNKWVREFADPDIAPDWVDFDAYGGIALEERLSLMCGHVCRLHEQRTPFGLLMPGVRLEPGISESHLHQCLLALARYGAAP